MSIPGGMQAARNAEWCMTLLGRGKKNKAGRKRLTNWSSWAREEDTKTPTDGRDTHGMQGKEGNNQHETKHKNNTNAGNRAGNRLGIY